MIGCFGVEREGIVRFDPWLDFTFPFGLRFRRTFVTIPLATFYLVGPLSNWGDLVGRVFVCVCILSFFLNERC